MLSAKPYQVHWRMLPTTHAVRSASSGSSNGASATSVHTSGALGSHSQPASEAGAPWVNRLRRRLSAIFQRSMTLSVV
ncbi:MAG: hypothetical protein R2851_03620 [Caldilineaceae bacterium]